MGCGGSVSKRSFDEELQRSAQELAEEKRRVQHKDEQIADVRKCLQEHLDRSQESATGSSQKTVQQLREELEEVERGHAVELESLRTELAERYQSELRTEKEAHGAALDGIIAARTEEAMESSRAGYAVKEEAHRKLVLELKEAANAEAAKYRDSAMHAEREIRKLREDFAPLQSQHDQASDSLQEARVLLRAETRDRSSSTGRTSDLEQQLRDAVGEHHRSEQRFVDLEKHLRARMRDLQSEYRARTEELAERDLLLRQRDEELAEVNNQLLDLQGLFDDVNKQLQTECSRIEKLQETVSLCAKQSKELEQLQGMLQDSHRMLAQVRDALEEERTERVRVEGLLSHEQQRTQLLLDVLKHFKEKLQGMTPQMLLNRMGGNLDAKASLLGSLGSHMAVSPEMSRQTASPVASRPSRDPPAQYVGGNNVFSAALHHSWSGTQPAPGYASLVESRACA